MRSRISARTVLSHPGRVPADLFLATNQMDDESAAEDCALVRLPISVWIGQEASTTNPDRMIAATSDSQAFGFLFANTMTSFPSSANNSKKRLKHRCIPLS